METDKKLYFQEMILNKLKKILSCIKLFSHLVACRQRCMESFSFLLFCCCDFHLIYITLFYAQFIRSLLWIMKRENENVIHFRCCHNNPDLKWSSWNFKIENTVNSLKKILGERQSLSFFSRSLTVMPEKGETKHAKKKKIKFSHTRAVRFFHCVNTKNFFSAHTHSFTILCALNTKISFCKLISVFIVCDKRGSLFQINTFDVFYYCPHCVL
jgi:hypothetical protein